MVPGNGANPATTCDIVKWVLPILGPFEIRLSCFGKIRTKIRLGDHHLAFYAHHYGTRQEESVGNNTVEPLQFFYFWETFARKIEA